MAWRKSPQALIDLFDAVIPRDERIGRRKMFGYPAAFVMGKLFAGLHEESFILRLPEPDRTMLQAEHGARTFEPMPGRAMREYVVLPPALLADRRMLSRYLARSMDYVAAPPAKKSKRSKSGKRQSRARA